MNSPCPTFQVCQSGARTNHASHNCEGKDEFSTPNISMKA